MNSFRRHFLFHEEKAYDLSLIHISLMISSGELPDLIYTDNTGNMISLLSDPDLCWSWEDLMAESNTDFTFDESRAKINRTNDGKFYTIRNNYSTPEELEEYDAALVGVCLLYTSI